MKQKKQIDIVVKYFFPVTAGIETNIAQTYRRLVENGWIVNLHTSKDTYLEKDVLASEEVILGINVKRYSFGRFGFWPKIDYRNTEVVALHNFDMFPHMFLLIYSSILRTLGKKNFALVLTPHGGFNPEWAIFSKSQRFIKENYHKTLGKLLINQAVDGVRAVSDWEKEEMIKAGVRKDRVRTIANGLEDEAFSNVSKQASAEVKKLAKSFGKYIFGNARIYEIKNQETIIRALPLLPKDIKFVNIGTIGSTVGSQTATDSYKKYLLKLANELGVSDRVVFPGVIKGVDKYYLFKNAVCFVHMAIWESFCNVVAEAISQGQVCVVANNTALPFLVKDKTNGYLIETHDHKELAGRINFILDKKNSKEIEKIKNYNLEHGRENSWRNVAKKMEQFYLQLINENEK